VLIVASVKWHLLLLEKNLKREAKAHMKQIIFRLAVTAIIIFVLIQSGTVNALFMFVVAGILPGTNYVIPANIMMLAYCAVICAVLLYSTGKEVMHAVLNYHLQPTGNTASKSSPAKRRVKLI
jgi:hypothetical protein